MIVVGGVYEERCRFPRWDRIFGSGLRAAVAISHLASGVELHGYVPEALAEDASVTLASFEVANRLLPSATTFTFHYLHPFEKSGWTPRKWPQEASLCVAGEAVLRFGLMEGDAVVTARRAVYDPQSPKPTSFSANGSRAEKLVIVATDHEILSLTGVKPPPNGRRPGDDAIRRAIGQIVDTEASLEAVLLKDPLGRLTLYQGDEGVPIQTYAAESYFRIGAGDIIAAGFAYAWAEERRPVIDAADFAARCVAFAVEGPRLPLERAGVACVRPVPSSAIRKLRIVGGETLELQALAIHTKSWIELLGGEATIEDEVKEPHVTLLLVGETRRPDILERLARLARTTPSVLYWPDARRGELEAWFGEVVHARDYASALYRAMRLTPT